MKLTNEMREKFIEAVMSELPCIDYLQLIEDVMQKDFYEGFPPEIKAIWDNPKLQKEFLPVSSGYQAANKHYMNENTSGHVYVYCGKTQALSEKAKLQVSRLREEWTQQAEKREGLREKLSSVVKGVKTTQRLYEVLPEFEHHIPKEKEPTTMLPIASDVVATFMKAGWKPVASAA